MRKKASFLFAILLVFALAAGCNNNAPSDSLGNTDVPESGQSNEVLSSFSDLLSKEGLPSAIRYLNENYDQFGTDDLNEFLQGLNAEITARVQDYVLLNNFEIEESVIPKTIENVNYLYPNLYDFESNTYNINALAGDMKEAALRIKEDDLFTLCKWYYAMDGNIEDMGFSIIIEPDLYRILKARNPDFESEIGNYSEVIKTYTDKMDDRISDFESLETYPTVLVENNDQIEKLRNEWKTDVFFPVVLVEGETPVDSVVEGESPVAPAVENNKDIPTNIVLKNYNGSGVEALDIKTVDAELEGDTDTLAIFGTVYDLRIGTVRLYTEGNFSEFKQYDTLTDVNLEIKNSAPNIESGYDAVAIHFYDENLNFYTIYYGPDSFVNSYDNTSEVLLQSGNPSYVNYDSGEGLLIDLVDGSAEDPKNFKAFSLVDTILDYRNDLSIVYHLFFDADAQWLEYDTGEKPSLIPIWVSANMYDVVVAKMNWGEEESVYTTSLNIKAGTFLMCNGIFDSDGRSYEIRFSLKDGTKKVISIAFDESGASAATNNFRISIR